MDKKKEKRYVIYLIINMVNFKLYVGQSCDPIERWRRHKSLSKKSNKRTDTPFYRSIKKYGIDNFRFLIIKENLTVDESNYWEEYYISYYKTLVSQFGYNLLPGGKNRTVSDETRAKLRLASAGRKNTLGYHHTEESKIKMSLQRSGEKNSNYGKFGKDASGYGHVLSEKQRREISLRQIGEKNPSAKLSDSDRIKIFNLLKENKLSIKNIAKMFRVSDDLIYYYKSGKSLFKI
jgi:group I intron endonuclease